MKRDAHVTVVLSGDALVAQPYGLHDDGHRAFVELVRGADVAFTNLEILLNEFHGPPAPNIGIHLSASAASGRTLLATGFNLFAAANNHALDYGVEGLRRHLEVLRGLNMTFAGAGETASDAASPAYLEGGWGRAALVACASSLGAGWPAADAHPGIEARPGINPLRHETRYLLEAAEFDRARALARTLGVEARQRHEIEMGYVQPVEDPENQFRFLDGLVERAAETRVLTLPQPGDLERVVASVEEAASEADVVLVSLHTQEWQDDDEQPAEFARTFARACVDGGANIVAMSGPHVLRGIELYGGAPIFYSLGNLWFEYELLERVPADSLVQYGLTADASPDDFADIAMRGFQRSERFWQCVLPRCSFVRGELREVSLHPISLNHRQPRGRRGQPELAGRDEAARILARLDALSRPCGTRIRLVDGVSRIDLD